jgi:hypothetical protein
MVTSFRATWGRRRPNPSPVMERGRGIDGRGGGKHIGGRGGREAVVLG